MPRDDCAQPEVARKDLETEIDILQRLQHPNIVEMLGAGFVNPLDVDAVDGEEHGEFRDLDQACFVLFLVPACLCFPCVAAAMWWTMRECSVMDVHPVCGVY